MVLAKAIFDLEEPLPNFKEFFLLQIIFIYFWTFYSLKKFTPSMCTFALFKCFDFLIWKQQILTVYIPKKFH